MFIYPHRATDSSPNYSLANHKMEDTQLRPSLRARRPPLSVSYLLNLLQLASFIAIKLPHVNHKRYLVWRQEEELNNDGYLSMTPSDRNWIIKIYYLLLNTIVCFLLINGSQGWSCGKIPLAHFKWLAVIFRLLICHELIYVFRLLWFLLSFSP